MLSESSRSFLWLLLATLMFLSETSFAQEANGIPYRIPTQEEEAQARTAAEKFLAQIDRISSDIEQASAFYAASATGLKTRYSLSQLSNRITSVRAPLGTVLERTPTGFYGPYHSLPNLVLGDYLIVVFRTRFDGHDNTYTEQVTVDRSHSEADTWRFVEYYVAPLLSHSSAQ